MHKYTKIIAAIFILHSAGINYSYAGSGISARKKQIKKIERSMADEKSLPEWTGFEDYIRVGLKRNPGLKASFYKWKAAFKEIAQAFSLQDPTFTYTNYIEEVETRVGAQQEAYAVMQKFPLPDKLWLRKNKAFRASEEAFYNFEKKRLDLIYHITDVYYEYAYLASAIDLTKENMDLLRSFEAVAQIKYASGRTRNQDLLKVQVELGKLENELISLKDRRKPILWRLNTLLNLSVDTPLPWPDERFDSSVFAKGGTSAISPFNEGSEYDKELISVLKENNPHLKSLHEKIKKEKESLRLAKREYFPDISVGVKTVATDEALNPSLAGSGDDPLMVQFSINLPIWFNRIDAEIKEAKAYLQAAEEMYGAGENELFSKLEMVYYRFRDSMRQSSLYKDALIPKAVQTLEVTKRGYEAGDMDFLSLIDAQRVLLDFQLAYYRYSANSRQRLAELNSILGDRTFIDEEGKDG